VQLRRHGVAFLGTVENDERRAAFTLDLHVFKLDHIVCHGFLLGFCWIELQ